MFRKRILGARSPRTLRFYRNLIIEFMWNLSTDIQSYRKQMRVLDIVQLHVPYSVGRNSLCPS